MSLVVLGVSHHDASFELLESVTLDEAACGELSTALRSAENLHEAVVLSTCNRTEIFADAATFHGAVTEITAGLASVTGVDATRLKDHLHVHYEDRAAAHLFSLACGLDSMAVGETQILGQLRSALARAQADGSAGPILNGLLQHALRVGKRAHAETGIDRVSRGVVDLGLEQASEVLGSLGEQRVLVIGAGSMGALAATTVERAGAGELTIINRTAETAERLADRLGARALPISRLAAGLAGADLVVSTTGARGLVVDLTTAADAQVSRGGYRQVYLDLALPRDIAPEASALRGVTRIGLDELRSDPSPIQASTLDEVRDLVTAEVAAYLTERATAIVAPTVTALRAHAAELVSSELTRLERRVPDLDEHERAEVRLAVHRIVEKLLHHPTKRVKELAGAGEDSYAAVLIDLFDLDHYETATVTRTNVLPEVL